jgi:hypothetical protein
VSLKRAYFMVKRVNFLLVVFAIFLAAIFFGADFTMKKNLQEYLSFSNPSKNGQELTDDKITAINEEIDNAILVQKDFFPSSKLIEEASGLLTDGISLHNLRFDLDKKTAKISGLADSRENFLIFKDSLEFSKIFIKINYPLTSILQKQNIEFEISAELDLSQLPIL